jgi:hypothetical protein
MSSFLTACHFSRHKESLLLYFLFVTTTALVISVNVVSFPYCNNMNVFFDYLACPRQELQNRKATKLTE